MFKGQMKQFLEFMDITNDIDGIHVVTEDIK